MKLTDYDYDTKINLDEVIRNSISLNVGLGETKKTDINFFQKVIVDLFEKIPNDKLKNRLDKGENVNFICFDSETPLKYVVLSNENTSESQTLYGMQYVYNNNTREICSRIKNIATTFFYSGFVDQCINSSSHEFYEIKRYDFDSIMCENLDKFFIGDNGKGFVQLNSSMSVDLNNEIVDLKEIQQKNCFFYTKQGSLKLDYEIGANTHTIVLRNHDNDMLVDAKQFNIQILTITDEIDNLMSDYIKNMKKSMINVSLIKSIALVKKDITDNLKKYEILK